MARAAVYGTYAHCQVFEWTSREKVSRDATLNRNANFTLAVACRDDENLCSPPRRALLRETLGETHCIGVVGNKDIDK